jgi:DNA mismatch repair ATPase MutS
LRNISRHVLFNNIALPKLHAYFPQVEFIKTLSSDQQLSLCLLTTHLVSTMTEKTLWECDLTSLDLSKSQEFMRLDANALQQLEIVSTEGEPLSFFTYLNRTGSPMGKRMLL